MNNAAKAFRLLGLAAIGLAAAVAARAQDVASFYKANNLTITVGSGAGGGYDVYTRVMIRTYAKHIPGNPKIIVQNMPGAAGIKALNHVYAIAPKDGSVIDATYNTLPLDPLFGGEGGKYDSQKLSWIGSIGKQINVCIAWKESAFKTFDDTFQREMALASSGAAGWRSILPRMMNNIAGTKFKVIDGYETNGMIPAVERGEVDGMCTTYETLQATAANWLQDKKIIFLAQFGRKPIADLSDVPMGLERIRNPEDLDAVKLVLLQQEFGRPYVGPPALPADRLKALRDAFDATMKDPAFLDDAKKAGLNVDPTPGPEIEALIRQAYGASPDLIERGKEILARASH